VVINEVGWMGTKANSSDEWIELYNPGSLSVNLSGWVLSGAKGSSNSNISLTDTIAASSYFVLAGNSSVFHYANGSPFIFGQTTSSLSLLNNPNQNLELIDPSGAVIDSVKNAGGYWPAGSTSNYASIKRYYPHGGPIDPGGPWVTYASPTTNNIIDSKGNPVLGTPGIAIERAL
jgi:Lamin Tail Domain